MGTTPDGPVHLEVWRVEATVALFVVLHLLDESSVVWDLVGRLSAEGFSPDRPVARRPPIRRAPRSHG